MIRNNRIEVKESIGKKLSKRERERGRERMANETLLIIEEI